MNKPIKRVQNQVCNSYAKREACLMKKKWDEGYPSSQDKYKERIIKNNEITVFAFGEDGAIKVDLSCYYQNIKIQIELSE